MKVQAIIHCTGKGYRDFKPGEIRELPKKIAELLIQFGYARPIKQEKSPEMK